MPYSLEVIWDTEITNDTIHKFRNFGEDVWREFNGELTVSLEEIDGSTDRFSIKTIKPKQFKRVLARLEKISDAHFMSEELELLTSKE